MICVTMRDKSIFHLRNPIIFQNRYHNILSNSFVGGRAPINKYSPMTGCTKQHSVPLTYVHIDNLKRFIIRIYFIYYSQKKYCSQHQIQNRSFPLCFSNPDHPQYDKYQNNREIIYKYHSNTYVSHKLGSTGKSGGKYT